MINQLKIENKKENIDDYNKTYLRFIQINSKNKLEDLSDDMQNQILMDSVNSISVDKDENIGKELNKFFIKILPENKDSDVLKLNYVLSSRILENSNLNKNQIKTQYEEYMTQIMNIKINQSFILTREISEKLSFIFSNIFKKLKKKNKFKTYEDLIEHIKELAPNFTGILEKFKEQNEISASSFIYVENPSNIYDDKAILNNNKKKIIANDTLATEPSSRISTSINAKNQFNKSVYLDINNTNNYYNYYRFKEIKNNKKLDLPLEIFILKEKFENIKKLKLILKQNTNNNELLLFESKDIYNNIYILLNLKWLFPFLFEVELDLTNESILKDLVLTNNDKYKTLLKKAKRIKKTTYYQTEYKKRIFDVNKKTAFNEQKNNLNNMNDENELLTGSFSMLSSAKDNKDEEKKKQDNFLNLYTSSLEMIIIYWYFISRIENVRNFYFTTPINYEKNILSMLKEKKITLFDFNILSNLSSDNIIEATLDFNSLDNKLFNQILVFLFKNLKMKNCRLSFFPSEEYFEPQFLYNLLLNSDNAKGLHYINTMRKNEETDLFLLRKLSEYFEFNINKFFSFFINNTSIKEFSLIFDIPNILNKINCYEIILIKLIINMLIYLDNPEKNNYSSLNSFTIIAENLFFDNRKHPFLNSFLNKINIFQNKNFLLEKFTLKLKMFGLTNIYKIIPYHVNYLSLGAFDLETFQYFVEYITSTEFNIHSEIKALQIDLGMNILSIEQCYDSLEKLLVEHPRNLEEISIYTYINTNYFYIKQLLEKTNYNKIEKIFIQFGKKSLEDPDLIKKYGRKLQNLKGNKDNNFIDLYFVKKNEKNKDKILRMMYKVGQKYNKLFMDCEIFLGIEKFISEKDKKQIIIQYK